MTEPKVVASRYATNHDRRQLWKAAIKWPMYAVAVMQDGKTFFARKEVKVTLGGCGG